jgi:hypothetical protein
LEFRPHLSRNDSKNSVFSQVGSCWIGSTMGISPALTWEKAPASFCNPMIHLNPSML